MTENAQEKVEEYIFFSVTVIPGIGTSLTRTRWLKQLGSEVTVEQTCEAQSHLSWQLWLEVRNLIP